ncbi:sigma 54-interacting transcriptional regulator [Desulfoprunum benzoelyticum]|uniref:Transcriptional regulator with PAS, ATPase and Fis domain n=1 Tax=Desulfoprunum benzoelyticum TaxID=1506996 RepID=A0A840UT93_9BACT|nr:sigma 54-interacting transcriptional regulator [Desulfoprunum benzoelyticum]MBB5349417.1 transcriptional regulator with PAS, ATPase and Fis domain [Desulfoprunum benzoelyticum]MBM9531200.1 sigma 54-interacting transcriptional regulator [Desulfoprunum benzoelyticum]
MDDTKIEEHKAKLRSLGEEYIYALIDNPYECPIVIGPDGVIVFISRYSEKLLGIDADAAVGKHVTEVVQGTHLHEILKDGKARIGDMLYIGGRQQLISRIPLKDFEGRLIGAVGKGMLNEVTRLWDLQKKVELLDGQLRYYQNQVSQLKGGNVIIGQSAPILDIKEKCLLAAKTTSTILITGESGTGKEVIAYFIHQSSQRADQPFIKVNCASIPPELFESELFGYEHGAFTGARSKGKMGKFEMAHGGTILLDEIGELPLSMQAKLLRVLQERTVDRLGGTKTIPVDFRLIAATNRDLSELIKEDKFRIDLYFRINVFNIQAPSLRQMPEDIPLIANYLLSQLKSEISWGPSGISDEALELMQRYSWPGNVRELRNVMEKASIIARGNMIMPEDLPEQIRHGDDEGQGQNDTPLVGNLKQILEETEKKVIEDVLRSVQGNKSKAADILGIHRTSLYDKLNKAKTAATGDMERP